MPVNDVIQQKNINNNIIIVSYLIIANIQCNANKVKNDKQPIWGLLFRLLNIPAWFKLLPKEKKNRLVEN